jgi:hypothetical protein
MKASALRWWLFAWTLAFHGAAALVPALAGPVQAPVLQHECPNPTIRSAVVCPSAAAVARGTPWKCNHDELIDSCSR